MNHRISFYDWLNGYFVIEVSFQRLADESGYTVKTSGSSQISSSIDSVRYVFVCVTKLDANGYRQEESIPYTMNIFSLDG